MNHPWEHTIRRHRQTTEALERAVQRPSIWENDLRSAPADGECVRCAGRLDPDRNAICRRCTS